MAEFGKYLNETLVTNDQGESSAQKGGEVEVGRWRRSARRAAIRDDGTRLSESDLASQFLLFQFGMDEDGPGIIPISKADPSHDGSEEQKDALATLELVAFRVAESEGIDAKTKATIRIDFGKDEQSRSPLDTLFWSIAAGLDLYNNAKNEVSKPKDLNANFSDAFSRRPIDIPGALGRLRFEVIKHQEPKWWQKVFSFLQSGTGSSLTAALGFPAISTQALSFINEMVNELIGDDSETLFESRAHTLALTKKAQSDYTGGFPGASVAVLNPGWFLLARGRDYETLSDNDPKFDGTYGLLRPGAVSEEDFISGRFDDPFKDLTYGVIRVRTKPATLDPVLDFDI